MIGFNYHPAMQEPEDPRIRAARRQLSAAEEAASQNDYRMAVQILMNCTREMINFSEKQSQALNRLNRRITTSNKQWFQE